MRAVGACSQAILSRTIAYQQLKPEPVPSRFFASFTVQSHGYGLARCSAFALLVAATLTASGADNSPAAPAPPSTPAAPQTFSTGPNQPFIPWNQPVINSSPWDRPDVGLLEVDPRHRWLMQLDENPLSNLYVPPAPPALAEAVTGATPLPANSPASLLDFASEIFYMPYGQMLDSRVLSAERNERISRYRSERDRLVADLRTLLDQTKNLPEPRRTDALREFSSAHTSRAAALEAEAEAIRLDLTSPSLFRFGASAYDLARSADGSRDTDDSHSFAYILPLLGAQFYAGFSADQRLLLREMTMEQRARAHPPSPDSKATPSDYIFFLPSTSRIKLPAGPPPALAEKIHRFRTQKEALKAELQSALDRDQFRFVTSRTERFVRLAHAQAPAFAALHTLAEEIRRELAGIHYPDAPSAASLPVDLTERVGHATSQKAALQRELLARFKSLQSQLPGERVEIVRRDHGLALMVAGPPSRDLPRDDRERLLAELHSFNASLARRYADLAKEMDTLRRDLRDLSPAADPSSAKDVNRLAAEFDRSYKKQETWKRYRDYHAAVLMPGLSPELRRLLYRAAWNDLFRQQVAAAP